MEFQRIIKQAGGKIMCASFEQNIIRKKLLKITFFIFNKI